MNRISFFIFLLGAILLSSMHSIRAGCDSHIRILSSSSKENLAEVPNFSWELENIEYDRKKYFKRIKPFKSRNISKDGVFKILDEPIELDYLFEIYAVSYPRGARGGELWHIRPRKKLADQIVRMDGKKYIKLETEFNSDTKVFFEFFYRTLTRDSKLGDYWSTRESPKLFKTLRREWNADVSIRNPEMVRIELKFMTSGADSQSQMAELRWQRVVGLANPSDKLPYVATGQPSPDLKNPKLEVSAHTGRVTQKSSLALHDWQEMDSAVWMTYDIANIIGNISWMWLHIQSTLPTELSGQVATHEAARKISKIFLDHRNKNPDTKAKMKGFSEEGTTWSRLIEIEMYRSQRAFHGYGHLQSTLIQLPKGEGLQQDSVISKFGPVNQREFDMHRWSLGFKAGIPPATFNPLLQITYENGISTEPLALENAIESITNGELQRLKEFADLCPNDYVKRRIEIFLGEYPKFTQHQIARLAEEQRRYYKALGKGSSIKPPSRIKEILRRFIPWK